MLCNDLDPELDMSKVERDEEEEENYNIPFMSFPSKLCINKVLFMCRKLSGDGPQMRIRKQQRSP
jgi:hypothetical protein